MSKYGDWTLGETEAILNIIGGVVMARAVLRSERKLTVSEIVRQEPKPQPPARPPFVGRVVKTIVIPAYDASDFAEAVRLGEFDNDTAETVRQFAKERVGLARSTKVELVEFDRNWWNDEATVWGVANGNKKPIETPHIMGIAIKLPNEQRERPIVVAGSVRGGDVLYLNGASDCRLLNRYSVKGACSRDFLVGFLSE